MSPSTAKTCGECPCFKRKEPYQYIMGDGWCDIKLPHNMKHVMWGEPNPAIGADYQMCSFGPLLVATKNQTEQKT